jgi:hypothetical protein
LFGFALMFNATLLVGCVYVLSEILPVEAQIHIRTLVLFINICN